MTIRSRSALLAAALAAYCFAAPSLAGETLKSYNVDLDETTVSGVSSGAFFATQIHIAHSRHIKGVGNLAGGPYFCAEGDLYKAYNAKSGDEGSGLFHGQCMGGDFGGIDAAQKAIDEARQEAGAGRIDALGNLTNDKIYIYGGSIDPTVVPAVVSKNSPFYTGLGVPANNIHVETSIPDGHAMPMRDSRSWANDCGARGGMYNHASVSPWMSNCNYDAAGIMLEHFYGPLNARVSSAQLQGRFVQFNQGEFSSQAGARYLNTDGFAYIPSACEDGEECRVHVAFHGCHQVWNDSAGTGNPNMGDKFYRYAGYNEWAENNNIIVLYPQTKKAPGVNPRGCWDWWGFEQGGMYGPCSSSDGQRLSTYGQCGNGNYHTKQGAQIKAVWAMVERIAGETTSDDPPGDDDGGSGGGGGNCQSFSGPIYQHLSAYPARVKYVYPNYQAVGSNENLGSDVLTDVTLYETSSGVYSQSCNGGGDGGDGDDGDVPTQPGSWTQFNRHEMPTHLYVPGSAPAFNDKRALMVSLHGCAMSNNDMKVGANWQATADRYGMVVALPDVPGTGASGVMVQQCWDYYGTGHSRGNKYNDNLLALVNDLLSDSSLNIDPDQVYITGISSGGSQAMLVGCLAPEVFAGWGSAAGPTIGTGSGQVGSVQTNQGAAVSLCNNFAGSNRSHFSTQIASTIAGKQAFLQTDGFVATGYSELNAEVMASIYGASKDAGSDTVNGGGVAYVWSDSNGPRASYILVEGMGHAWPAGPGSSGGGQYIDHAHVNYPAYVTAFFFDNNRRAEQGSQDDDAPAVPGGLAVSGETANSVSLSWNANGESDLAGYNVYRSETAGGPYEEGNGSPVNGTSYTVTGLAPETTYYFVISAEDESGNESGHSAEVNTTTDEGTGDTTPPPAPTGLSVSNTTETSLRVSWSAVSAADLAGYRVYRSTTSGGSYTQVSSGLVTGTNFTANGLDEGTTYYFVVKAEDTSGNTSEYSSQVSGTTQGGTAACTDTYASNWSHMYAGRAEYCGFKICAVGSGDSLGYLYSYTTVKETSSGFYELGGCN